MASLDTCSNTLESASGNIRRPVEPEAKTCHQDVLHFTRLHSLASATFTRLHLHFQLRFEICDFPLSFVRSVHNNTMRCIENRWMFAKLRRHAINVVANTTQPTKSAKSLPDGKVFHYNSYRHLRKSNVSLNDTNIARLHFLCVTFHIFSIYPNRRHDIKCDLFDMYPVCVCWYMRKLKFGFAKNIFLKLPTMKINPIKHPLRLHRFPHHFYQTAFGNISLYLTQTSLPKGSLRDHKPQLYRSSRVQFTMVRRYIETYFKRISQS